MASSVEYYKSLPKKRMGAGALFFDEKGNILILKTTYKENWEIPGGVVEDNESPRESAEREIKEELGFLSTLAKLLVMDYQHPTAEKTESIMFIFDGGILNQEQISKIRVQNTEISDFKFETPDVAFKLLGPSLGRRVEQILKAKDNFLYLEDREVVQ